MFVARSSGRPPRAVAPLTAAAAVAIVGAAGLAGETHGADAFTFDREPEIASGNVAIRVPVTGSEPTRPGWAEPPPGPSGYFFRATGAWYELQTDARFRDGSGPIGTEDGFGGSFAVGWRDLTRPIVFEVEYAFRQLETDDFIDPNTSLLADNQLDLHTISANLLFDAPNLLGPVGVYAGAGIGARISEARIRVGGESGTTTRVSGEGLLVQAMAGITVTIDRQWQAHAGVRWSDGGTIDGDLLRYDTESLAFEVGFRLFF
jgi:opacity protein-like surface antigen